MYWVLFWIIWWCVIQNTMIQWYQFKFDLIDWFGCLYDSNLLMCFNYEFIWRIEIWFSDFILKNFTCSVETIVIVYEWICVSTWYSEYIISIHHVCVYSFYYVCTRTVFITDNISVLRERLCVHTIQNNMWNVIQSCIVVL